MGDVVAFHWPNCECDSGDAESLAAAPSAEFGIPTAGTECTAKRRQIDSVSVHHVITLIFSEYSRKGVRGFACESDLLRLEPQMLLLA